MRRFLPAACEAKVLAWPLLLLLLVGVAVSAPAEPTKAERELFAQTKAQAEKGSADAQLRLAALYARGQGVSPDPAKAAKWHRQAAEQGLARAQYCLGHDYAAGFGVKPDPAEATRWFHLAAEQGLAEAQLDLGLCYANGGGVSINAVEAAGWFQRAADQGYAEAQYQLGKCYFEGTGVSKHVGEGLKWTQRAAEQGHPAAQYRLGLCYINGEGVAKDPVQAYKWLALASAQGDDRAADARVDLAKTETLLTREQVAEAQRLAREFKPRQESPPGAAASAEKPAPAAGPATGWVNVKVDDETSEVFVDGAFVGNPPARLQLPPGSHVVEVKKSGFKDYRKTITVSAGAELNLRAMLEKR